MEDLMLWFGQQLDEDERIAREAALSTGRTGYKNGVLVDPPARWGDDLVADGKQWVARYHVVARKRLAAGEPSLKVAECAGFGGSPVARHAAEWDPARVLREIDSKRRQVEWCVEVIGPRDLSRYEEVGLLKDDPDALAVTLAVETLRLLAAVYADRPGYREQWRP